MLGERQCGARGRERIELAVVQRPVVGGRTSGLLLKQTDDKGACFVGDTAVAHPCDRESPDGWAQSPVFRLSFRRVTARLQAGG